MQMQLGQDDNCFVYIYVWRYILTYVNIFACIQMSSHCFGWIYGQCVSEFYNALRLLVVQLFGVTSDQLPAVLTASPCQMAADRFIQG